MTNSAPSTDLEPVARGRSQIVRGDRLPVTEFAFDRPGAGSPFGDDLRLPLPVSQLTYVHPTPAADPMPGPTSDLSHH